MPDPSIRSRLSDLELVELAEFKADKKSRSLRTVKDDTIRDSKVIEDRRTGERFTVPNKFIRSIGINAAFELMNPDIFESKSRTK
tara:strand:+ start:21641 stop:21895 length:255 start_codon:yes stop_codon:yes gene_type:complete